MAYDPKHLKWINSRRRSALFDFIKPQKEYKKPPKVFRVKKHIKQMKKLETEDDM